MSVENSLVSTYPPGRYRKVYPSDSPEGAPVIPKTPYCYSLQPHSAGMRGTDQGKSSINTYLT